MDRGNSINQIKNNSSPACVESSQSLVLLCLVGLAVLKEKEVMKAKKKAFDFSASVDKWGTSEHNEYMKRICPDHIKNMPSSVDSFDLKKYQEFIYKNGWNKD